MSDDREFGVVRFSFSVPLKPWGRDPTNYFFLAAAKIIRYLDAPEECDDEELAGQIGLTVVKFTEAFNARMNFGDIFREASLGDVHAAIFDKGGDLKDKLKVSLLPGEVLFINSVKLKAKHRKTKLLLQAIEAIIPAISSTGLVLAYRETLELRMKEWKKLCFVPIRGTNLIYRDDVSVRPRDRLF